jgi:hypothetical protein
MAMAFGSLNQPRELHDFGFAAHFWLLGSQCHWLLVHLRRVYENCVRMCLTFPRSHPTLKASFELERSHLYAYFQTLGLC